MATKLIIPKKIHNKYTYLLNRFKDLEWSGPAWYKVKTDKDGFPTEWRIVHFHPLDLGSHAATEWEAKDLAKILKETYNTVPSLKKSYMGLIHSHNTMGAFLSGTDTDTIQDMAPDEGFYGSLVVASAGKALHAFGFGYKDQYKCAHSIEVDEDDIEINIPGLKPEAQWVAIADKIEKSKPKTVYKPSSQVALWNGNKTRRVPNVNTIGTTGTKSDLVDKKTAILDKLTSKKRDLAVNILLKNDTAEMTDIAAEDALQKLGVDLMDVLTLMDDGYNYGYPYGGYNGFY